MLLCQIQTSFILKKVSLSASLSNTDISYSQKGEFKMKNSCNYCLCELIKLEGLA